MTPKECEAKFQVELTNYRQTGNPKSWEWVWICVQECCSNTIKSKAKGLVIPDFDGKVTDSVIKVMEKIQGGFNGTRDGTRLTAPILEKFSILP